MTKESSLKFNEYSLDTFKEYGIAKFNEMNTLPGMMDGTEPIPKNYYRQIELILEEYSLENVFKTIDALLERKDIELALPFTDIF